MDDENIKLVKLLIQQGGSGVEMAFMTLLNILYEKKMLTVEDFDKIHYELTDMSGNYDINANQRASIERMAETFAMLRADQI